VSEVARKEYIESIIQSLSVDFLVDAGDTLDEVVAMLGRVEKGATSTIEGLNTLRREAHNLKGMGGSFGFSSMTLIAHRLEDYLLNLAAMDVHHLEHSFEFVYALQDIVEKGINPSDDECSRILRTLPAKGANDRDFTVSVDLEILLITTSQILRLAVEGQLHSRGYRVVTLRSPLAPFETAIRSKPDMVIASAVMNDVGGVDLARAFAAMSSTSNIPFVLLTSFAREHPELHELPSNIRLMRHDLDLDGEVSDALSVFKSN
jgi:CheY-like chemotaxis protein